MTTEQFTKFKYTVLFKKHLNFNAQKPVIAYDFDELISFFADCAEMFKTEATLLELCAPVVVVADIHGQYEDLHRIFASALKYGSTPKMLFLGDIVDRGEASLQCYIAVLIRKLAFPSKYHIVRGNHENVSINERFGFFKELRSRYPLNKALELHRAIGNVYNWTPLAALIDRKILCLHGGIGPSIRSLEDISKIERPIDNFENNPVANDLLWADPDPSVGASKFNEFRKTSVLFGDAEVERVCRALKIDCIVRGHQCTPKGYSFPLRSNKLVLLFSAPGYCVMPETKEFNDGAIALVQKGPNGRLNFKFRRLKRMANSFGKDKNLLTDEITTASPDSCLSTASPKPIRAKTQKFKWTIALPAKEKVNAIGLHRERPGTITEMIENV